MPIWYLTQALAKLGITGNWSGNSWSITTPATMKPSTGNIEIGSGSSSIYINGKLVKKVDEISVKDPASGQLTTYMPIWYLTQILNELGVQASWNGSTLGIESPSYATQVRQNIVSYAKKFVGTPYVYGGESSSGMDCSGLVQTTFKSQHISLPRVAAEQATVGISVSKASLQPGDLVFFNTLGNIYSHVGIYVGSNQFISATSSKGVQVTSLDDPYYWGPRFTAATNPLANI